jgi:hypothetical protein
MDSSPAVRVSAARDLIDFLDEFEPGTREKVLSTFPRDSLEIFESSPRTSWLPIEHDHWVVDGVCEVLGRDRAIQCWRASVADIVDKPLLRSFFSGMVRVFGRDPARVVGLLPKGWELVYRDFAKVRLVNEPGAPLRLAFEQIAPAVRRYPNYLHSWNGVCQGIGSLARDGCTVRFQASRDLTSAEAVFSW